MEATSSSSPGRAQAKTADILWHDRAEVVAPASPAGDLTFLATLVVLSCEDLPVTLCSRRRHSAQYDSLVPIAGRLNMIPREFPYQLKSDRLFMRAALFGAGAVFLAWLALTNDRGLILFVIPLSRNGATISYAVGAGLGALMCVADIAKVIRRGSLEQKIVLTDEGLLVPATAYSSESKLIRYEDLTDLKEFTEPDHVMMVRHKAGDFEVRLDMLSDERAYAEIVGTLSRRIELSRIGLSAQAPDPPR
jgi:hypothetical protein